MVAELTGLPLTLTLSPKGERGTRGNLLRNGEGVQSFISPPLTGGDVGEGELCEFM